MAVLYKGQSSKQMKLEHVKSSLEQSMQATMAIIEGRWIKDGKKIMNDFSGIISTKEFLNELNEDLHPIQYIKYIVPSDFYSSEGKEPQSIYVANLNYTYSPETVAAKEFSKLITSGVLERLKRCKLSDCENVFLGPPNATWCSKTCGSKFRVRKKRNKNLG